MNVKNKAAEGEICCRTISGFHDELLNLGEVVAENQ
jgi:hypothetical protein